MTREDEIKKAGCGKFPSERMLLYALDGEDREFAEHVDSCSECSKWLDEYVKLISLVNESSVDAPERAVENIMMRARERAAADKVTRLPDSGAGLGRRVFVPLAAAAVLVLAIALGAYFYRGEDRVPDYMAGISYELSELEENVEQRSELIYADYDSGSYDEYDYSEMDVIELALADLESDIYVSETDKAEDNDVGTVSYEEDEIDFGTLPLMPEVIPGSTY